MSSFVSPLLRGDATGYVLTNARSGKIVATQLIPAFDSATRRRGLLGRSSLPGSTAIIIAPSNAVHTFFMRFAIDIAFVARDGRILKVRTAVPPRRMTAAWRAYAVVEMTAGALVAAQCEPGDTLVVTPAT